MDSPFAQDLILVEFASFFCNYVYFMLKQRKILRHDDDIINDSISLDAFETQKNDDEVNAMLCLSMGQFGPRFMMSLTAIF